jgi:putative ABC transport system permease protein
MALSVRERTREIGVLKTLGFPGPRILRMVLSESILLALIGGLPGLALAAVFILAMRDSLVGLVPQMRLAPEVALAGIALMVVLGLVTGLIPALNAMRLKIASALGRS